MKTLFWLAVVIAAGLSYAGGQSLLGMGLTSFACYQVLAGGEEE